MGYSELVKDLARIRGYMRQFYIYGFRKRAEYTEKSARSYDNERRRIESWLGEHMSFRRQPDGKISFISVDTREISHNPLYRAFKAKSFTSNDIILHFYILDILEDGEGYTISEIADIISDRYLSCFKSEGMIDESTIRKKLTEYEKIGLVIKEKTGRKVSYRKIQDDIDLESWRDALSFFSETDPLGVIGSYLLARLDGESDLFAFKHHYILFALDSEIMYALMTAMTDGREVRIKIYNRRRNRFFDHRILPIKIYVSTQDGRSYAMVKELSNGRFGMYRLDNIRDVREGAVIDDAIVESIRKEGEEFANYLWNTSNSLSKSIDHVRMTLRIAADEEHILGRLRREGRHGNIIDVTGGRWVYEVIVYDALEIYPWIRTFTGRIENLESTNEELLKRFNRDKEEMYRIYDIPGGEEDAVQ